MPVKFLVLRGVLGGFFGGECRFYFYGREDFSDHSRAEISGVGLVSPLSLELI